MPALRKPRWHSLFVVDAPMVFGKHLLKVAANGLPVRGSVYVSGEALVVWPDESAEFCRVTTEDDATRS